MGTPFLAGLVWGPPGEGSVSLPLGGLSFLHLGLKTRALADVGEAPESGRLKQGRPLGVSPRPQPLFVSSSCGHRAENRGHITSFIVPEPWKVYHPHFTDKGIRGSEWFSDFPEATQLPEGNLHFRLPTRPCALRLPASMAVLPVGQMEQRTPEVQGPRIISDGRRDAHQALGSEGKALALVSQAGLALPFPSHAASVLGPRLPAALDPCGLLTTGSVQRPGQEVVGDLGVGALLPRAGQPGAREAEQHSQAPAPQGGRDTGCPHPRA